MLFLRYLKQVKWGNLHQNKFTFFKLTRNEKLPRLYLLAGLGFATLTLSNDGFTDDVLLKFAGFRRFFRSLKIGMQISFDYSLTMLGIDEKSENGKVLRSLLHKRSAERILQGCLQNGGTYIKMGQGLVCMNHILPEEYIKTLKVLQDKCLVRDTDELDRLFLDEFGQKPDEIFDKFDHEPIAAASLAQVFKAITKNGDFVAVKVQYIDLQQRFLTDMATIEFLLKIVGFMHKDFNFSWLFADIKDSLKQELDFLAEGKNSEKCARDLKHLKYVYVPKVFWELSSSRVLVTEFIDGYKVNETTKLVKNGFSLADIDKKIFEICGVQIFQTGFVHADPHPGNILIRKMNNKTEVVLLDHGLYQKVTDFERTRLSYIWKAIVRNNKNDLKTYSLELGVKDFEMFAEILTQSPFLQKGIKLKTKYTEEDIKYMKEFVQKRFDRVMEVLREVPRSLLLVLRNLNTIRAIAREHGDPIDRYAELARIATRSIFVSESFAKKLLTLKEKVIFEVRLLIQKIYFFFLRKFMIIFYRIPELRM